MYKVKFIGRVEGEGQLEQEQTLLVAAKRSTIELTHRCGGHARCGSCKVTVVEGEGHLSPKGTAESRVLEILGAGAQDRLACQAWAHGDVTCQVD